MDQFVFKAFMANSTVSLFPTAAPTLEKLAALRKAAAEAIVIACEQNVDAQNFLTTTARSAPVHPKAEREPRHFRRTTNGRTDSLMPFRGGA